MEGRWPIEFSYSNDYAFFSCLLLKFCRFAYRRVIFNAVRNHDIEIRRNRFISTHIDFNWLAAVVLNDCRNEKLFNSVVGRFALGVSSPGGSVEF